MAAPLILARSFREAHAYATQELGLSVGYYRVVNSVGTIKAVRGVDLHLVPGWDKRPDRFTMRSALRYTKDRLNIIDVEKVRESQAAFDAAMPPAPEDPTVHWVTPQFAMAHAVEDVTKAKSSSDQAEVDCKICLDILDVEKHLEPVGWEPTDDLLETLASSTAEPIDEPEPEAEMPEPAEAEEATDEPAPVDETEPEIVVAEDNRTTEPEPVVEAEPTEKPKARRRRKCAKCEQLHYKGDPCIESEDS